jgi:hypothetical protein
MKVIKKALVTDDEVSLDFMYGSFFFKKIWRKESLYIKWFVIHDFYWVKPRKILERKIKKVKSYV